MTRSVPEVFDSSKLPDECPGGLKLLDCDYTFEILGVAANHRPDLSQGWERRVVLYPPEGDTPRTYKTCKECGRLCIATFKISKGKVEQDTTVELEYELPSTSYSGPVGSDAAIIRDQMMEPAE
ncbi:hypothetical protein A3F38_00800 [Candidatus Saccharibacteria bacterium RIFCSPHIGHO2_12_FULL_48_21]|nr:MAG: hypothetical protein A3F38_00800 [Candidatus Saccharibacteria bacterium RIFCSPHIGHO2_12_FULL_48_21]